MHEAVVRQTHHERGILHTSECTRPNAPTDPAGGGICIIGRLRAEACSFPFNGALSNIVASLIMPDRLLIPNHGSASPFRHQ